MRFLNVHTLNFQELDYFHRPKYAVLSCCASNSSTGASGPISATGELTLGATEFPSHVLQACKKAEAIDLSYLWAYEVCVDRNSTVEREEAVNSSFNLLQHCSLCIVYLDDFDNNSPISEETWGRCRWWTRAWTVQELIAAPRLEYFASSWEHIGTRETFLDVATKITGINPRVILDAEALSEMSIGTRMSWFVKRNARTAEDLAYALVGIFGVSMQIRLGEGAMAFTRLQEEILHHFRDGSIFAWSSDSEQRGLLARSPAEFAYFISNPAWENPWKFDGEVTCNSKGLKVRSRFSSTDSKLFLEIGQPRGIPVWVELRALDGAFIRTSRNPGVGVFEAKEGEAWFWRDFSLSFSSPSMPKPSTKSLGKLHYSASDTHENTLLRLKTGRTTNIPPPKANLKTTRTVPSIQFDSVARRGINATKRTTGVLGKRQHESSPDTFCEDEESISSMSDECDYYRNDPVSPSSIPETLTKDQKFLRLRKELYELVSKLFRQWEQDFQYMQAPIGRDGKSRPKRVRTGEILDEESVEDEEYVLVSRIKGQFHLVCPYYAFRSTRYSGCLQCALCTIQDVKWHLNRFHQRAAYCPNCKSTFESFIERDDHVRAMECDFQDEELEGLSTSQIAKLDEPDDPVWTETELWLRIFRIVCPNAPLFPRSPYLCYGKELSISMFHDFWARNSRELVRKFLDREEFPDGADREQFFIVLKGVVSKDLLDVMIRQIDLD